MDSGLNELIIQTITELVNITGFDTRQLHHVWDVGIEKNYPGRSSEGEFMAWAWLYVGGLRDRQHKPFTKDRITFELGQLKRLFSIAIEENPSSRDEIHQLIKEFCNRADKLITGHVFTSFFKKEFKHLIEVKSATQSKTITQERQIYNKHEKDDARNLKIILQEFKDTHEFVTRYFNLLNEFTNTTPLNRPPVTVSQNRRKEVIYPKGRLDTNSKIALFLNEIRQSLLTYNNTADILRTIYILQYLNYWNQNNLESVILSRNLSEVFNNLEKELKIKTDIYSFAELEEVFGDLFGNLEEGRFDQQPSEEEDAAETHSGAYQDYEDTWAGYSNSPDKKQDGAIKRKHVAIGPILRNLWPVWLMFILVIVLIYATMATTKQTLQEQRVKVQEVTYNETISTKISFKDYLENIYDVEGTDVVLKGFLKRYIKGTELTGVYVESVMDDNNNTIRLVNLTNDQKKTFPKKGVSENIYEVKGSFKRDYKTLLLEVQSISLSERTPAGQITKTKIEEIKENITSEVIKPKYPLVRSIVFDILGKEVRCSDGTLLKNCAENTSYYCSYEGLTRNPALCGCPKGQRAYKGECIKEVKCTDGTFEPECSKTLPKQCIGGVLSDNANLCGCPPDYKKAGNACKKIQRCSDGTIYGECSTNKPYVCSVGKLVKDAELCGCDWGYKSHNEECIDSAKAEAMEALDHVNELRAQYGRSKLRWNEQLYQLALFRAKDMYDRKYFDHVTPDGLCVKNFKTKYGLSQYNIAENAGARTYGGVEGNVDYASYADPTEQVDGWMESRGHRYNLLYPAHTLGAVSCYKGACIFLGANTEPYGLGSGNECTTGDQGLAYWKTASAQANEV